ncbi:C-type lectin domain-containing protein [Aquisphaera insulae]|uniref:C-type lectin domain-containing protein n=1 Tax=Aquisphaera insulae TaxID=2712864 RepID=UPI0013E9AE7F|nr:C-type lectin domain-containing protein [Aquisphaera insulae]
MLRVASIVVTLLVLGLDLAPPAEAGFVYYAGTGHWYGLTDQRETWTAAEAEAVADGGHLASITSQGEQDFLVANFVTASVPGGERQPFWIGLVDTNFSPNAANRNFQWTDGSAVTYTDWNPGEPNNNTGNEWYTAFNFHYGLNQGSTPGTWNDTTNGGSVNGPYRGIIELSFDPAAIPEPASLTLALLGCAGPMALVLGMRARVRRPA